jgi:hypothetical protein
MLSDNIARSDNTINDNITLTDDMLYDCMLSDNIRNLQH